MSLDILKELRKVANGYQEKAPPVPLAFNGIGKVGHIEKKRGVYINPALRTSVASLLKYEYEAERVAREMSNGRMGAYDILPVVQLGSDTRDAIRAIKSMESAINSWDAIVNARGSAHSWDFLGTKASQTTVASAWSSFLRTAGVPSAMSVTATGGTAPVGGTTAGTWPLPMTLGGADNLYMTNFGQQHATGTNITLVVDVLTYVGGITSTLQTSQAVSSTTLPRWTGGAGVQIIMEVQTALGTSTGIPNLTVNYTNQGGTSGRSTGAVTIGASSLIAGRLFPIQDGPLIRLAAGDYGVQSISQSTFSASTAGAGANYACIQYMPLLMAPTLATTTFIERATPATLGGIVPLTSTAGGSKAAIGFLVLTSTTSTGIQMYFIDTVWG